MNIDAMKNEMRDEMRDHKLYYQWKQTNIILNPPKYYISPELIRLKTLHFGIIKLGIFGIFGNLGNEDLKSIKN